MRDPGMLDSMRELDHRRRDHHALMAWLSAFDHAYHAVDFDDDDYDQQIEDKRSLERDLEHANVVSSALVGSSGQPTGRHTIALDIDHRVRVIPSSTYGHHHLYIDVDMEWREYALLLAVLAQIGVLEPGYVKASMRRKATHLRLPWVEKDDVDGAWARCTPALLNTGVSCATSPRRPCDGNHEHLVALDVLDKIEGSF